MSCAVLSFYLFKAFPAESLPGLQAQLLAHQKKGLLGLVLLAAEGMNATVAGPKEALETFKNEVEEIVSPLKPIFKWARAEKNPFFYYRVDIRDEIVTYDSKVIPDTLPHRHLTPAEWQKTLETEADVFLLDVRNWYETELG